MQDDVSDPEEMNNIVQVQSGVRILTQKDVDDRARTVNAKFLIPINLVCHGCLPGDTVAIHMTMPLHCM